MEMRTLAAALPLLLLAGCNSGDSDHKKTPGEVVGHAAYEAEKDAKKAAKEVSKDVKTFAHDAKEGFKDAKQKDIEKKKTREGEGAAK